MPSGEASYIRMTGLLLRPNDENPDRSSRQYLEAVAWADLDLEALELMNDPVDVDDG